MAVFIESFCKDSSELRCPSCAASDRRTAQLCGTVTNISPKKAIYLHIKLLQPLGNATSQDVRVNLPEEIKTLVTATPELKNKTLTIEFKRIDGKKGIPPIKTPSPLIVYVGPTPIYGSCAIKTIEAEPEDEKTPAAAAPLFAMGTMPTPTPVPAPAPAKKKSVSADIDSKLDAMQQQIQQLTMMVQQLLQR